MAAGSLNTQGVWIYGEDDSEATFSALLNKLGNSVSNSMKGRVVQVLNGFTTTQVTSSSTTYIDTTLSVSITPLYSNSKIVIFVTQQGLHKSAGNSESAVNIRLNRDSTVIQDFGKINFYTSVASIFYGATSTVFSEISGSTTARTYKTQFANSSNSSFVGVQQFGSPRSEIIVMEVTA